MDCTGVGQPCNVHPNLVVVQKAKGVKAPRASACGAKEIKKKQFQENLVYSVTSLNEKGGNSTTGNVSRRVFENSASP